jgi:Family of unknown function (DUF6481)
MKIRKNSKSGAMRRYKDDELADRLKKAASARSAILEKFRSKPSADEPAEIERRAARQKMSEARDLRAAERRTARLAEETREAAARADRKALEGAQRIAREQQDAIGEELHRAGQKAKRDARYAARKARKKS